MTGRRVLLIDDVLDSGFSLLEAKRVVAEAGAEEILITVFADKPWPTPRAVFAHVTAWKAPAEFLIGYALDDAGRYRGLPQVRAI